MKNVYDEIIQEGDQIAKNGMRHLRKSIREISFIAPVKIYAPEEIKRLRTKNMYTQQYFSELLGVSIKTVQAWEAGIYKPNGAALRLFQILEHDPHILDSCILIKT